MNGGWGVFLEYTCITYLCEIQFLPPSSVRFDYRNYHISIMQIKHFWSEYIEKANDALNKPPFKKAFDLLEDKIKVGRTYIATAVVILLFWLALGLLAPLVVNIIAFTYPAIQSIKSLESKNGVGAQKWLTYWIVYGYVRYLMYFYLTVLTGLAAFRQIFPCTI